MKIRIRENQLEEIEGLTTEYPYTCHHANLSDATIPWHWHEELEFCYIVSGAMVLTTTNQSYTFEKGEGFFINTNVLCTMNGSEDKMAVIDSHLFHSVFLGGHYKSIFFTRYIEPVLQNRDLEILEFRGKNKRQEKILQLLRQAALLYKQENTAFQIRNIFSDIWLLLSEELQETKISSNFHKNGDRERIQTMIAYIQQNYQEKLSLEDIAGSASVSKSECLRCFRNNIQRTPFEYLLDYRIEAAGRLLRTTELSVVEIALQTGFSNSAYFGKVFKSAKGVSPGKYRFSGQ